MQQLLVCGETSARVDILCRFVKFFHSLRKSACHEVQVLSRYLARDLQSVTGKNLDYVQTVTGLNPWVAPQARLRDALVTGETVKVPPQDEWRLQYLLSLLRQRREAFNLAAEEEEKYLTDLINSLVAN